MRLQVPINSPILTFPHESQCKSKSLQLKMCPNKKIYLGGWGVIALPVSCPFIALCSGETWCVMLWSVLWAGECTVLCSGKMPCVMHCNALVRCRVLCIGKMPCVNTVQCIGQSLLWPLPGRYRPLKAPCCVAPLLRIKLHCVCALCSVGT